MNKIVERLTGMDKMSDQVIATDLLISAKTGIQNYAIAISEAVTPNVRMVLRKQLNDAIVTHEAIMNYMMKNGYYNAYEPKNQIKVDMTAADTALNLQQYNNMM